MTEENNPLLVEIRDGLGSKNIPKETPSQQSSDLNKTKEEMSKIISELKQKMIEIDKITAQLDEKRRELDSKASPKKTEKILQEIKVPSLEMLK